MESGQPAIFQWDFVIEFDQLEEHVANQKYQIFHIAGFILQRHELHPGSEVAGTFW